jgi:hypothetical protein
VLTSWRQVGHVNSMAMAATVPFSQEQRVGSSGRRLV